jgi:hypothetical protein
MLTSCSTPRLKRAAARTVSQRSRVALSWSDMSCSCLGEMRWRSDRAALTVLRERSAQVLAFVRFSEVGWMVSVEERELMI